MKEIIESMGDRVPVKQLCVELSFSRSTLYRLRQPVSALPSLIFYDDVPGGAGHVRRIYNNLRPTLEAALARLKRCECGIETSCYSCLRNYQNQFIHDKLQRRLAMELLEQILDVSSASSGASSA